MPDSRYGTDELVDYRGNMQHDQPGNEAYIPGENDELSEEGLHEDTQGAPSGAQTPQAIAEQVAAETAALGEDEVLAHSLIVAIPEAEWERQLDIVRSLFGEAQVDEDGCIILPPECIVKLQVK